MASQAVRRQLGHSLHSSLKFTYKIDRRNSQFGSTRGFAFASISQVGGLYPDFQSLRYFRQLERSLMVVAENAMGPAQANENSEGILQYENRCGRCKLQNVKVVNNGVNWNSKVNVYWKHDLKWFESLKITLHGNAEFEAVDVVLQGHHT